MFSRQLKNGLIIYLKDIYWLEWLDFNNEVCLKYVVMWCLCLCLLSFRLSLALTQYHMLSPVVCYLALVLSSVMISVISLEPSRVTSRVMVGRRASSSASLATSQSIHRSHMGNRHIIASYGSIIILLSFLVAVSFLLMQYLLQMCKQSISLSGS